ncbi:MAG TPA: outer membrane protein assembly factor BamE [Patescibacteria group bacterium]|nr:outer membrane protein assembly factor BamE [Patescibacteria group bacterium]
MKSPAAALILTAMLLSACAPTVTTHGNLLPKHQLEQVKVQESGREDVERIWGPPTALGSFDNKTWYYIGETDKHKGIFRPEVERRQIIKVVFDEQDRVAAITSVDPKSGHDVDLVSRTTPSAGKEFTAVQQFVGNLGKFNKADK